jgi:hypothetical protein
MMQKENNTLRERVNAAWPAVQEPAFDDAWKAAGASYSVKRRNARRLAGAAAAAAIVAIAIFGDAPVDESYVEVADLMDSTYWAAPSDVLLPERQFDIYQDMPELFESTEPAGGTLL